jgi:hypothetical protein
MYAASEVPDVLWERFVELRAGEFLCFSVAEEGVGRRSTILALHTMYSNAGIVGRSPVGSRAEVEVEWLLRHGSVLDETAGSC